jgi:hypothetical protein
MSGEVHGGSMDMRAVRHTWRRYEDWRPSRLNEGVSWLPGRSVSEGGFSYASATRDSLG